MTMCSLGSWQMRERRRKRGSETIEIQEASLAQEEDRDQRGKAQECLVSREGPPKKGLKRKDTNPKD